MTRDEAVAFRRNIESVFATAAPNMTVQMLIQNRALCAKWDYGKHAANEIRTVENYPFKCRQDHDTEVYPDIVPGGAAWGTFWIPFHGTSVETALPFVQPTGAHDMYLSDEYAVFDVGVKKCIRDTAYTYIDDPTAWEDA
jgi:hypothetical protein